MKLSSLPFLPLLISVSLSAAITLDTTLPQATSNQPYSTILNPQGGSPPYVHTIASGSLPLGISLSPSGRLEGTTQFAGSYTFLVQITDSLNATAVQSLSLQVNSLSGLTITNNNLPAGRLGAVYDTLLSAQGGTQPYAWDLKMGGGSLPPGLTFNSEGRMTGTPTSGGVYPVIVRVTDIVGNSYESALTFRVDATSLTISTNSLSVASTNVPYSQSFAAIGGTAPYSFSLLSGSLPTGITLSPAGLLSGTPTSAGTFNFLIRATDAANATTQANFSLIVAGVGPRFLFTSLPTGMQGTPYNATFAGQGGTPPYSFTLLSGALPTGLMLSPMGSLSGTSTSSGIFPISVRLTDAMGMSTQSDFNLNFNSGALDITNITIPPGAVGNPYNVTLAGTGGVAPVAYTILSGTLPAGLTLGSNGVISGTPTAAGSFPIVIRATDAASATSQLAATLRILASTLAISSSGLANAQLNQPYTSTLSASGGSAPYTFNLVTGTLPTGLTLSPNGNISGTPTAAGIYQVTYRVVDSNQRATEYSLPLYVSGGTITPLSITLPAARANQAYSTMLQSSGGTAPYTYALAVGSLPTGLTLAPNGVLSGTVTQTTPGAFTIRTTDSAGLTSLASYLFNVNNSSILLSSNTPAMGQIGQLYNTTLTTSGGTGLSTFSLDSGSLPPGLTLGSGGTLSGTPTAEGVYIFNIRATDATSATSVFSQSITILSSQLGFGSMALPNITLNSQYSAAFTGINGTAPYTFTLVSGTLPPGLTLAPNGNLTGMATTAGAYPVTIRITDASGASATTVTTLNVSEGTSLAITTAALPSGRINESYRTMIVSGGGSAPYSFALASGSTLPAGMTLSTTGLLSGTPTTAGTSTFTVTTMDANGDTAQRTLTLIVNSGEFNVTTQLLPNAIVGSPYSAGVTAINGTAPYSFSIVSGTLPPGLTFSNTGMFTGTPTLGGAYPIVVRVTDTTGAVIQRAYRFLIGSSALAFTNITLPMAYLNQNYRANLQAAAGMQPYTFSIVDGMLPAGLTLDSNGVISGIPTANGQSTVTFRVTDSIGSTAVNVLTIATAQSNLNFGFTSLPDATVGQAYNFFPNGTNTGGPAFYYLGGLPPGISVTPFNNLVGVPTQEGVFYVQIRAVNGTGEIVQSSFPLRVLGAGFRITSLTLPNGQTNQAYSQTLTATGASGNVTYTLQSGTLPSGITLSPGGVISGSTNTAGVYNFTVRATDGSNASTTAVYALTITAPVINFTTISLPSGTLNQSYNQTIAVSGGTGPYTYTINSGTLPTGLTLSSAGVISGVPTAAGNSAFSLRATDSMGQTSTVDYLIGIGAVGAPALTAIVNAANYVSNGVAPGEIVVLYGTSLGPANLLGASVVNNVVATSVGGTRVLFDGVPAPILYTSATQVATVVPFGVAGKANTLVTVESLGVASAAILLPVRSARPSIFTSNASGSGSAAALNQNATVNSSLNPAERGSIVSIYVTGLGQTTPASMDGQIVSTTATLVAPVTASINGQSAEVIYAGNAPGLIPGLAQINLRLPSGVISGPNSLQLTSGANSTPASITIFVR
jgi:uncharacterized protein (TIGR03437 family)